MFFLCYFHLLFHFLYPIFFTRFSSSFFFSHVARSKPNSFLFWPRPAPNSVILSSYKASTTSLDASCLRPVRIRAKHAVDQSLRVHAKPSAVRPLFVRPCFLHLAPPPSNLQLFFLNVKTPIAPSPRELTIDQPKCKQRKLRSAPPLLVSPSTVLLKLDRSQVELAAAQPHR